MNQGSLSRQPAFKAPAESEDHSREYYNSHILRSLERYAQKTVDEKKAQRDNLSSKTHLSNHYSRTNESRIVPPSRLSYDERKEKRTSDKPGKENALQRQESVPSLAPSVKSQIVEDSKIPRHPFQEVLNSNSGNS